MLQYNFKVCVFLCTVSILSPSRNTKDCEFVMIMDEVIVAFSKNCSKICLEKWTNCENSVRLKNNSIKIRTLFIIYVMLLHWGSWRSPVVGRIDDASRLPTPPAVVFAFGSFWCVQSCQKHVSPTKDVAINIRENKRAGRLEGNRGSAKENCNCSGEMWKG
jgi:hypothetical protein